MEHTFRNNEKGDSASGQVERIHMRPGPGWNHFDGPVWEHTSGSRIHLAGMIRLPNGTHLWLSNWHEGRLGRLLVQINGGNRKRGLMAWAMTLVEVEEQGV